MLVPLRRIAERKSELVGQRRQPGQDVAKLVELLCRRTLCVPPEPAHPAPRPTTPRSPLAPWPSPGSPYVACMSSWKVESSISAADAYPQLHTGQRRAAGWASSCSAASCEPAHFAAAVRALLQAFHGCLDVVQVLAKARQLLRVPLLHNARG